MDEIWRPVVGHEGLYEVSSLGRVRSLERTITVTSRQGNAYKKRVRERMLCAVSKGRRYPGVSLGHSMVGGATRTVSVHVLVAEAFIGPIPDGMEVCHWDGDKINSSADNLVYETHIENEKHKIEHGTKPPSEDHGNAKLSADQVREIRLIGNRDSRAALATHYDISEDEIGLILRGKVWKEGPWGTPKWRAEIGGVL